MFLFEKENKEKSKGRKLKSYLSILCNHIGPRLILSDATDRRKMFKTLFYWANLRVNRCYVRDIVAGFTNSSSLRVAIQWHDKSTTYRAETNFDRGWFSGPEYIRDIRTPTTRLQPKRCNTKVESHPWWGENRGGGGGDSHVVGIVKERIFLMWCS